MMTKQELTNLMGRVGVALNRHDKVFTIHSNAFGDRWAVFVVGDFDSAWLEVGVTGHDEPRACDVAWSVVRRRLHDAIERETTRRIDALAALSLAADKVAMFRKALGADNEGNAR